MIRRPVRFNGLAARRPTAIPVESPDTNFLKMLGEFQARYSVDELKKLYYQLYDGIKLVESAIEHFKAVKQGDQGIPGEKPTSAELLALIRPLLPEVKDGKTPTPEEVAAIVQRYLVQPQNGKDGISPTSDEIATKLVASKKLLRYLDKRIKSEVQTKEAQTELNQEDIIEQVVTELEKRDTVINTKKIEGRFAEIRNQIAQKSEAYNPPAGSKRGGGDTVVAGTGVTITNTRNGNKQISASGGAGFQAPTSGAVDGSNTIFVWATAPNVIVVDGGRSMQRVSSDGTVNWTVVGTTTTLTIAPNFDIYAVA